MKRLLSVPIITMLSVGTLAMTEEEQRLLDQYAAAIRHIESTDRYDIKVNAGNDKDGKPRYALGAYQIMNFNLPSWSKESLEREVTEEEFLASKEIQDEIFRYHFSRYVQKYGPAWAAKAWLAGPKYVERCIKEIKQGKKPKKQPKDVFGTTPDNYAKKFFDVLAKLLP